MWIKMQTCEKIFQLITGNNEIDVDLIYKI